MDYFANNPMRGLTGKRLAPFQVERPDYRTIDQEGFYRGLERNGPKAVQGFQAAFM